MISAKFFQTLVYHYSLIVLDIGLSKHGNTQRFKESFILRYNC